MKELGELIREHPWALLIALLIFANIADKYFESRNPVPCVESRTNVVDIR